MPSPFRQHQISTRAMLAAHAARAGAAAGAAPAMPAEGPVASEYQGLLARLHDDLRRLHDIPSRDAKTALKAEAIETYLPWVNGVLAMSGDDTPAPQDEIVVTMFIWAIDIRDWTLALALFGHIDQHGLALPERFHRSPRAMLISEMADAAINEPCIVPHDALLAACPATMPVADTKNETLARLHRAIGESWARQADAFDPNSATAAAGGKAMLVDAALTALREATRLDPKVGVKKLIEALEREARRLAPG